MTRLRFIHAADLHLDSPFIGLRTLVPAIADKLRDATFAAYENIIDLCIRERVDALLVAGDIFDGADRSLRAQLRFADGLNKLSNAGITSFVCHGNHDPLSGWEARLTFGKGVHRFGAEVSGIPVFPDDPSRAMVFGISYPQRDVRENLVPQFDKVTPGPFNIGLLHANVDNKTGHDAYAPCTLGDLQRTAIDYWALGHVHTRQVLRPGNPTVVYPGNPQGRHLNEPGARGVYLVEVSDSGDVRLDFQAMDVVRWAQLEVDISDLETEQSLLDRIERELAICQNDADGRSVIFRLVLTGRGQLHLTLNRPSFADDLLERVNAIRYPESSFLWCERIQARTAPNFDRKQQSLRTDFVGDLLRLCDETLGNAQALDQLREKLQELYGARNQSRYLQDNTLSDEHLRDLVASAEGICLDELLDEDIV